MFFASRKCQKYIFNVDFFQLEIYFSIPREIVLRSFIYVDLLRHTSSVTSRHGQLHKPLPWIQALQTGLDVINLLFFFQAHLTYKPRLPDGQKFQFVYMEDHGMENVGMSYAHVKYFTATWTFYSHLVNMW
jgi:hypothetical protein